MKTRFLPLAAAVLFIASNLTGCGGAQMLISRTPELVSTAARLAGGGTTQAAFNPDAAMKHATEVQMRTQCESWSPTSKIFHDHDCEHVLGGIPTQ